MPLALIPDNVEAPYSLNDLLLLLLLSLLLLLLLLILILFVNESNKL
jgi:hypothetical protein